VLAPGLRPTYSHGLLEHGQLAAHTARPPVASKGNGVHAPA
jgi:hypothetical protein